MDEPIRRVSFREMVEAIKADDAWHAELNRRLEEPAVAVSAEAQDEVVRKVFEEMRAAHA